MKMGKAYKSFRSRKAFNQYWYSNESEDSEDTKITKDFLRKLTIEDKSYDKNLVIDGKLWLRELFMMTQANQKEIWLIAYSLWMFLTSASYLAGAYILEEYTQFKDERFSERTGRYMPYHILCMLGTWNVNFFNGLFLFYAHKDSSRRIHLMRFISCSLKIKSTGKNSHQIKLPTLNFLDTESLETWLEARKIVSQLGKRF